MMILRLVNMFFIDSLSINCPSHTCKTINLTIFSFAVHQTAQDNIDLQTTILSRFDLIFIVKDIRMYDQDKV